METQIKKFMRKLEIVIVLEFAVALIAIGFIDSEVKAAEAQLDSNQNYMAIYGERIPLKEVIERDLDVKVNKLQKRDEMVYTAEEVQQPAYSWEDVELLANIMWLEEGIYLNQDFGEEVHKLCGSVVLHRVESDSFANSIYGVLHQKGQYAKRTKENIGKVDIPDVVYVWAEDLLRDGPLGPENLVFQDAKPHGEIYKKIGNQYFCLAKY